MDSVVPVLEMLKDRVHDAIVAITSCALPQPAKIKVNGRSFKIVRILGEGGFSFVYLAQDEQSGVSWITLALWSVAYCRLRSESSR